MDDLQYVMYGGDCEDSISQGFKPCYKWMTFNTPVYKLLHILLSHHRFKPCYKWMTFNTSKRGYSKDYFKISFKPCYKWMTFNTVSNIFILRHYSLRFKPCYKWMTFNTQVCWIILSYIMRKSFKPCYKWMTFNTSWSR